MVASIPLPIVEIVDVDEAVFFIASLTGSIYSLPLGTFSGIILSLIDLFSRSELLTESVLSNQFWILSLFMSSTLAMKYLYGATFSHSIDKPKMSKMFHFHLWNVRFNISSPPLRSTLSIQRWFSSSKEILCAR